MLASPTPSPTPAQTPSPAPPADPGTFGSGSIQLDRPSGFPGGSASLTGRNCPPGSAVSYTVEGTPAGSTTAGSDGSFHGAVQLPDAAIGEYPVEVSCAGHRATVTVDLVVASSASSPATSATAGAVLVFFVLFASVLLSGNSRPVRPVRSAEPDDEAAPPTS